MASLSELKLFYSCFVYADKRADVLQKVEVRVIENSVCREWYASQGKSTRVESEQMCAGYEEGGRDSCWVSEILLFIYSCSKVLTLFTFNIWYLQ